MCSTVDLSRGKYGWTDGGIGWEKTESSVGDAYGPRLEVVHVFSSQPLLVEP